MSVTDRPHFTRSGLAGIDTVPYGMHACHFYASREELVAALGPYFAEGLRARERCLWITAPPLPSDAAAEALRAVCDGVDEALASGALRIVDYDQWYERSAKLKGLDVVKVWLDEEAEALAEGYSGLRITGNVTFLQPDDWPTFMEYEQAVTSALNGRRIIALCSYALDGCDDQQIDRVMHAHHCAFEHTGGTWQVAMPKAPRI